VFVVDISGNLICHGLRLTRVNRQQMVEKQRNGRNIISYFVARTDTLLYNSDTDSSRLDEWYQITFTQMLSADLLSITLCAEVTDCNVQASGCGSSEKVGRGHAPRGEI